MRSVAIVVLVAGLSLTVQTVRAQPSSPLSQVGEEYEITKAYETLEQGSDGSSSSSRGHETIIERVLSVREDGLEVEYDLPNGATAEERVRSWQFPARLFRSTTGRAELLNRADLETRVSGWLKSAGWPRTVCGQWIFTWNAFRIECDPQSVIKAVEDYDLRSIRLRVGGTYRDVMAKRPGTLTRASVTPKGETYTTSMEIDPEAVRRARAESDVAVGEIMNTPVTLDSALRERAKESVSGRISIAIDTDCAGSAWRQTKVTRLQTKKPDGVVETSTATETVTRRVISQRKH
jgi:hypothetical protein